MIVELGNIIKFNLILLTTIIIVVWPVLLVSVVRVWCIFRVLGIVLLISVRVSVLILILILISVVLVLVVVSWSIDLC